MVEQQQQQQQHQYQQPKSVRTDKRTGERRLRFVSNKERSASATADVYRTKDKITGVVVGKTGTTTSTSISSSSSSSPSPVILTSGSSTTIVTTSQFTVELDLALDRNTCEVFQKIYNRLFPLSRSLPEILHHLPQLLDILLQHGTGLDNNDDDETTTTTTTTITTTTTTTKKNTNVMPSSGLILALPDTLHLIAILAKETREELHPYVHTKVFPRLLQLITDPTYSAVILPHIPIVEALFRTISNVLRYDTLLLTEEEASKQKKKSSSTVHSVRKYYGPTLGHKSPLIRRLAGQTFGLFLRKFHAIQKHIQHILRAYITSISHQQQMMSSHSSQSTAAATTPAISNTMDGISWMFYFAVKGVPGQLHSKGLYILQIILEQYQTNYTKTTNPKGVEGNDVVEEEYRGTQDLYAISTLVSPLISNLLLKLCNHMNPSFFTPTWDLLFRTLHHIQEQKHQQQRKQLTLKCMLDLIEMCASFNEHYFLSALPSTNTNTSSSLDSLEDIIVTTLESIFVTTKTTAPAPLLTSTTNTNSYNHELKESMLRLVCTLWKARPTNLIFHKRIPPLLLQLLKPNEKCETARHTYQYSNGHYILLYLAKNLLPHLPIHISLTTLVPTVLQASLSVVETSQTNSFLMSLVLFHTVATNLKLHLPDTTIEEANDDYKEEEDTLFYIDSKLNFVLSSVDYNKLWTLIMYDVRGAKKKEDNVERIIYVLRCIPLLLNGNSDDHGKMSKQHKATKILQWLSSTLKFLDKHPGEREEQTNGTTKTLKTDLLVVAKALLLELTSCIITISKEDKMIISILEEMYLSAQKFLKEFNTSVWTMRGVSYFFKSITTYSRLLQAHHNSDNNMVHVDEIFDLLVPNLRQTNHYLRLYTLSILSSLPTKSYVIDHADIDFTHDLDEEPSNVSQTNATKQSNSVFCGTCDLISILYQIEKLPLHIDQERRLTSYISRVEVLGRSGKLPVVYAEAAANHMLGILSFKFSPIWPAATKAFAGVLLSSSSSTDFAEQLLDSLISKIESVSFLGRPILASSTNMSAMPCPLHNFADFCTSSIHHQAQLCTQWEDSNGTNIDLFRHCGKPHGTVNQVLMPKSRCTDESTLFQLVMGAVEAIPDVVAKKSRRFVSLFIGFMHCEYFAAPSAPIEDSRELSLSHHVEKDSLVLQHSSQGKNALKKKLVSFLKVFAAISGPQQLYKHKLLSGIFLSLLSSPDHIISQLGLEALSKYKFVYLVPYMEHLRKILMKGEMKSVLLGLDLSKVSGILAAQHRELFIPVLSRLLFGKLMAKGGGKSAKDTPKLRRRAVLSFFSKLASNEGELDYFIYLMVRAFIPSRCSVKLDYQESGLDSSLFKVKQLTMLAQTLAVEDVVKIRYQKQVGFLNLISDAISYLGYGIHAYTEIFLPILLSICEHSALHPAANLPGSFDVHADQDDCSIASEEKEAASINEEVDTEIIDASTNTFNFGTIRSLCYQGLSQFFLQFSPSFNFSKYSERMWAALATAIENLPRSVVNAPNCPSLLRLLNVLSSDSNLIPLLAANPLAVEAAFKCIDVTSQLAVMEVSMGIVENLLNEGRIIDHSISPQNNTSGLGRIIVADHLHLLITQLSSRICSRCTKQGSMGSLAKKELNILCQISDLIDLSSLASTETAERGRIKQETLNVLCSSLVSFLATDRHEKEEIRVHALHIVNNFLSNLSAETAVKLFVPLSKLLGPSKSNAGILSPDIRALVIETLGKISFFVGSKLHEVVSALKRLHTYDSRHVGEFNFEVILPTLNKLGDLSQAVGTWESFVPKNEDDEYGAKIILPLLFHCLHTLYSSDGVLSRGAFKALKTFVLMASQNDASVVPTANERGTQSFSRVLETSMMPLVRQGLHSKNDVVHSYFVQLLCQVCRNFAASASSSFCGDLNILIRDDDAELDFFLNTSHVQIHRRARALARLRREFLGTSTQSCSFTQSSLSNILLPLALRPLYSDKPSEETYALEAVATVGAIARYLTWPKYDVAISDLLRQFPRFPHQERFFIGAICSILDSFHFDVNQTDCALTIEDPCCDSKDEKENYCSGSVSNVLSSIHSNISVWKALNQRIIPRTEQLLMKSLTDKCGSRIQQLRSPIALALTKLFQKLPLEVLLDKVPRLLLEVCTALRSRDSDCREIARETLARMAASLGEKFLSLILNHLATTLTEGYQLHVRSAALHSILLSLSKAYTVPITLVLKDCQSLPFDQCVPAMIDLIMQDLFGVASEMKEVEYVEKRLVKEAMGSKTLETLEIICKCISFRPSCSVGLSLPSLSSVHNIVVPLLERLRSSDTNSSTIGKIRECLTKVVVGLSQNPTTTTVELMPFVHAVVAPFLIGDEQLNEYSDSSEEYSEAEDIEEDSEQPILVSRSGDNKPQIRHMQRPKPVTQWHPSSVMAPTNCKSALTLSKMQKRDMQKVLDGDSAPKLTGKARHGYLEQLVVNNLSDPSKVCGVLFGLSLLHSCLKKSKVDSKDPQALAMADPFVPMLAYCIMTCENNDIILLSLKLLGHFLYWDLPSLKRYQRKIASNVMKLLAQYGGVLSSNHEVTHGCFKALTLLFDKHVLGEDASPQLLSPHETSKDSSIEQGNPGTNNKRGLQHENRLPLSHDQMKVLISMLFLAVTSTEHHNSTFSLIKAIVSRRFLSAEFYDLMEKLLELSVQSLKVGVRQHASNIFMKFLLTYPLDHKRLLQHLQQIVLNIKYEYEEGRMSGIKLLDTVIGKLPLPLLKNHGNIFFFPLILQLVNDESNSCREAVARVITSLFQRSSMDQLQTYYDYMKQWFLDKKESGAALRRTSAQLMGFFVEIRADFFIGRKNKLSFELTEMIQSVLQSELAANRTRQAEQFIATTSVTTEQWEIVYFCLICLEKMLMQKSFFTALSVDVHILALIIDCLIFPHPWVQQVSCRMIWLYLQGVDTAALEDVMVTSSSSFSTGSSIQSLCVLALRKVLLFDIAKNVCVQLNFAEDQYNESHILLSIKILTWISLRMSSAPQLFYKEGEYGTAENDKRQDPLLWLFTRLANISKEKGILRRSAVFKCFASIITTLSREDDEKKRCFNTITPYLEVLLEALHRAVSEVEAAAANTVTRIRSSTTSSVPAASDLPKEVMNLLEEKCGTEAFLAAYSSVKMKAREKKMARKQQVLSEAVRDPKEAAKRKIRKQSKEKERKKRKIQERKASRGVFTKKPRI